SHGMYYYVPSSVSLSNVLELLATSDFCPAISSIVRASGSPTSASSVDFTVTFSEPVTGVDANGSDFELFTSGVSDASITNVSGSVSVYTDSVNTGSGNVTIRLDVPASDTIYDLSGNPLSNLPFTSGQ